MTPDPHLLAVGYPKCGNVWLRSLLASLLSEAGVNFRQIMAQHPIAPVLEAMDLGIRDQARQDQIRFEALRAYQDIPLVFGWAIPDLPEYVAATSMAHSHCMWKPETHHHFLEFSHRIIIVRDPRDVAVSWSRWLFTPFNRLHRPTTCPTPAALLAEDLPRRLTEWNEHQRSWLIDRPSDLPVHVVFYEQLVDDTVGELARIARHVGLEVGDAGLRRVAERNALDQMKQRQPHHIFRGGWGAWLEHLDDRQIHTAQRITGQMMKRLGYPLNRLDADGWTPAKLRLPERDTPAATRSDY